MTINLSAVEIAREAKAGDLNEGEIAHALELAGVNSSEEYEEAQALIADARPVPTDISSRDNLMGRIRRMDVDEALMVGTVIVERLQGPPTRLRTYRVTGRGRPWHCHTEQTAVELVKQCTTGELARGDFYR
jgi:hypothetical protein